MGKITFSDLAKKHRTGSIEDGPELAYDTMGGFGGLTEDQLIDLIDMDIDPTTLDEVKLEQILSQMDSGCHHRVAIGKEKKS